MAYVSNTSWDADFQDDCKHFAYAELSGSRDDHIHDNKDNMVPDLSDLTDEEFVERLAKMRYEHQQTLDFCSRLGLHPRDKPDRDSKLASPSYPVASVDENYTLTTNNHSRFAGDLMTTTFDDVIRPPFRARRAPPRNRDLTGSPHRKSTRMEREKHLKEKLENERQKMREDALDRYLASLSDDERWINEGSKTRRFLVRSRSLTKLADDGWRYRVTVPKSFKMTVRESQKAPTKSRSAADFERQRAREKVEDELECSMKFKASPAPATIYVPLYEELAWEKERRRRQNLDSRRREHAAMHRPFAFLRREEERLAEKNRRRAEFTEADARPPDADFKAKPFPSHLFSGRTYEQMCEEEGEMKKWQRTARAEMLLRTSSLPKNMTKTRPSHVCSMTNEDGDGAGSKSGVVRHSPARRRIHDDESIVKACRQVHMSPDKQMSPERRGSAAVCFCRDEQPRWPRTCLMSANQLSRSLSDAQISSIVADARTQSPAFDRLRPAPKSILKSTVRRRDVVDVDEKHGRGTSLVRQSFSAAGHRRPPASKATSSVGLRCSAKTADDHDLDRIRRQIDEDLKHIN